MAVLSSLSGISVAVHNDQGQLPEYADAEPDIVKDLELPGSVVVSNYIEAPPGGGPFWFKFRVESPHTHGPHRIMFRYEIQGTDDNSGKSCGPLDLENREFWETSFTGYTRTDERGPVFRNLWFAKLRIIPGDGQSNGITETEKSKMETIGKQTRTVATEQVAAKKGLSLGISYMDKPLSPAAAVAWPSTFINGWNNPIAVFQFKYRSRADLQRLQLIEKTPEPEPLPVDFALPILTTTSAPLHVPSLTPTPRAFGDLTFTEVRDLARKQYKGFGELNGNEIEKLAREKYSEETVHEDGGVGLPSSSSFPHASKAFEDLKFDEVLDLVRNQHKDFKDLNGNEIRSLAMQKHCGTMPSSQAAMSETPDARNAPGKRKAQIQSENADEDVIFVSATATKKRR
ncbi:hypothetical protein VE03_04448 [Pseudogymnoascus sp. 23342-1-I1]|nr:hypothetical protein VE03_04448 [Pseudogymnoascus sp. 23342-1-I1]